MRFIHLSLYDFLDWEAFFCLYLSALFLFDVAAFLHSIPLVCCDHVYVDLKVQNCIL